MVVKVILYTHTYIIHNHVNHVTFILIIKSIYNIVISPIFFLEKSVISSDPHVQRFHCPIYTNIYLISDSLVGPNKACKGTVVNRPMPSLHGGSFATTLMHFLYEIGSGMGEVEVRYVRIM